MFSPEAGQRKLKDPMLTSPVDIHSQLEYAVAIQSRLQVYKGLYKEREVAVKVLDWGDNTTSRQQVAQLRKAFTQEVEVWRNLQHANIVQVRVFHGLFVIGILGYSAVWEHYRVQQPLDSKISASQILSASQSLQKYWIRL